MKDHSHRQEIARMLHSRPYVLLKDLRWCNHRSRISELRSSFKAEGLIIKACIVEENGIKLHAFKTEPIKRIEPVIPRAQGELFPLQKVNT